MEATKTAVSNDQVANGYAAAMQGKMSDDAIANATEVLRANDTKGVAGTVTLGPSPFLHGMVTDVQVQLNSTSVRFLTFWGLNSVGSSPETLSGYLYTSDQGILFKYTTGFSIVSTATEFWITFIGDGQKYLGIFKASGGPSYNGAGGGAGSWS